MDTTNRALAATGEISASLALCALADPDATDAEILGHLDAAADAYAQLPAPPARAAVSHLLERRLGAWLVTGDLIDLTLAGLAGDNAEIDRLNTKAGA